MNLILLDNDEFTADRTATITSPRVVLHMQNVLKAKVGDVIKVGVIGGRIGTAKIIELTPSQCVLSDVTLDKNPPKKLDLTVILALPRPKVLRRLMMDMVAMGVAHIVLINSYRTDKSYWGSPLLSRLDEFMREGLEQGVDTTLPKITLAKRFKPFIEDDLPSLINHGTAVAGHPYAKTGFADFCQNNSMPNVLIIGPEGGFIDYEINLMSGMGVQMVSLGERILRTEGAVNVMVGRYLL